MKLLILKEKFQGDKNIIECHAFIKRWSKKVLKKYREKKEL